MYKVWCLSDEPELKYVPATRREFPAEADAMAYAATVAQSRKPVVRHVNQSAPQSRQVWLVNLGRFEGDNDDFLVELTPETGRFYYFGCEESDQKDDPAHRGMIWKKRIDLDKL